MNIERLRRRSGLSQERLASEIGVHQTAVSQWEKGRANPTAKKVSRLCEVLNCSPDELFSTSKEVRCDDNAANDNGE